jgi:RNA polymerase sigma-70 factor (ECF subfamily)
VTDLVEWAFRHHKTEIYRYLRRRTRSAERAEELTQEVFADATQAFSRTALERARVLPFLYTIARRRLVDDARRRGRRGEHVSLDLVPEVAATVGHAPALARSIRSAARRLEPGDQEILTMKLLEGRPFAEIAGRLHISEGAAKMRVQRALARFRDELRRDGIEP